ncbi:hypothetical protein CC79DRAFT_1370944 [Sarocladium strictum]
MGSSKRGVPRPSAAKARHKKMHKMLVGANAPLPAGLVAKPTIPKLKHHTYFEIVENKDKKKKLETKITTDRQPPPGFEFVPMGNPVLTTACKELSRERDAMIFIVSSLKDAPEGSLSHQVHRIGHHVRESIVEEARATIDVLPLETSRPVGEPEPIPTSQSQYNLQVDAAIRDLFPRIPNTDRQIIIEHAFDLRTKSHRGEKPVGLSADITLARRVQLAVLAHIRHTHTRYDKLRKETTWTNARRVVEALCLDILVKWRGDEETGRDQLDEILREVVVISDSEDSEDEDADISSPESDGSIEIISAPAEPTILPTDLNLKYQAPQMPPAGHQQSPRARAGRPRAAGKKEQRGFKRYRAWQEAIQRNRAQDQLPDTSSMHESTGHGSFPEGIGSGPQSFPSSHRPPPGDGRANSLLDPLPLQHSASPGSAFRGRPSFPGRTPLQHMMPLRRDSAPPQRPLSPPIQDRFKDLLVQSIESPSPDHTQPAFIRVLPPEKSELQKHLVAHESRPLRTPIGAPADSRSVVPNATAFYHDAETQPPRHAEFPGGFIQVSRRGDPGGDHHHPQHFAPPQTRLLNEPPLVQSRVRSRGADSAADARPAKRLLLEPSPLARPVAHYRMEDRGGFLEKVSMYPEASSSVPLEQGFIELRRPVEHSLGADRVVPHEEGRRLMNEPGVEIIPISSRPHEPQDFRAYGIPRPSYDHQSTLPSDSYHWAPHGNLPVHEARPQQVFRHVRGNGPDSQHIPPHTAPLEDPRSAYRGPAPAQFHPQRDDELPGPEYAYGPDGRLLGRHSYTPIVLD